MFIASWTTRSLPRNFAYHHRLPSLSPGFESQDPPSKSAASPCMLLGMVPVSPTGTNGSLDKMMWWAENIGLAGCSCAHKSSQSSPCQSILGTTICKICKICIWTWSMQLYATWASSFLIFLKNRDKGTVEVLPCLIVLWNKGEEEQHIAEPNIVDPHQQRPGRWKPPLLMPGGQIMTICWLLDIWTFCALSEESSASSDV